MAVIPNVGSALEPLQAAVRTRLINTPAVMNLVEVVNDYIDQDQPYPYIELGEPTEVPNDVFGRAGYQVTMTIHIWTMAKGKWQAYRIIKEMNKALLASPLTVSGGLLVAMFNQESVNVMTEPGGEIRHGIVRYTVFIQES